MDAAPVATAGVNVGSLLDVGTKEAANAPTAKFAIEVIKGTERSKVTFDLPKQIGIKDKESLEM